MTAIYNTYILKNKLKIHNYAILKYKYSAKKTTGQWTYIYGQGDQRVNMPWNVILIVYLKTSSEMHYVVNIILGTSTITRRYSAQVSLVHHKKRT